MRGFLLSFIHNPIHSFHSFIESFTGTPSPTKTLDCNDQNQVADQRFSLKQWFAGVLSLAGSQNLVVVIVIYGFSYKKRQLLELSSFVRRSHISLVYNPHFKYTFISFPFTVVLPTHLKEKKNRYEEGNAYKH